MQSRVNAYASLSELKTYFDFGTNEASGLNPELKNYLQRASRAIDRYCRKKFYPYVKTQWFDHPPDEETIKFNDFFLDLLGLSGQSGADGMPVSIFMKRCGADWNLTPYDTIEIDETTGSQITYSGTTRRSVKTIAVYGFRQDYEEPNEAWVFSGASLTNLAASDDTVLTTETSAGTNALGYDPRFQSEQLWRLGTGASQEFVWVTDTGSGAGGSTQVIRGVNGTTATSHAIGTPVYVWNPEPEIKLQTMRLALWFYEVRNNPQAQRHFFPQMGGFELADAWPKDVRDALDRYKGIDIRSF